MATQPQSWQSQTNKLDRAAKAKVRPKNPEKLVEKAIQQAFLLKHRIVLFKTDAGAAGMRSGLSEGARGYSGLPAGFSDLLGVIPGSGRALFVEVKREGGKPTTLQVEFLARRRAEGACAFWASSVDDALRQFAEQVGVAA